MKLETPNQDLSIHGNFRTTDFAVGDVAFIVDMFADKVYTNKPLAVIRELSCNAADSHHIAGTKDKPIDIHLPTYLEPFFSIRDYGTGLSEEDVRNVFAGIGISTKRNSDELIGCFGIGSLSPYSISDSFTVKSYFNGTLSTYNCYRDHHRKPVVALLMSEETDQPNGLEISVNTNTKENNRIYDFAQAAKKFFVFWEGIFPNINDESVKPACDLEKDKYVFKTEDFGFTKQYGDMYAVMGNVSYLIPRQMNRDCIEGYIKFKIGEVDFDTARENLSITEKTKKAIQHKLSYIKNNIHLIVDDYIQKGTNDFERAVIAENLSNARILSVFRVDVKKYELPIAMEQFTVWTKRSKTVSKITTSIVPLSANNDIIYCIRKDGMTNRIRNYLNNQSTGYNIVVFNSKEQADQCKVPLYKITDIEYFAPVPRKQKSVYEKQVIKIFIYNGPHWKNDKSWKEVNIDLKKLEKDKKIIFVGLNKFYPNVDGVFMKNDFLKTLCEGSQQEPLIYGFRAPFMKSKTFRTGVADGTFIGLDDFIRQRVLQYGLSKRIIVNKQNLANIEPFLDTFPHHSDLQAIASRLKDLSKQLAITNIAQEMGIDLQSEEDASIDRDITKFFEKYEMLQLVHLDKSNKSVIKTIANYINTF